MGFEDGDTEGDDDESGKVKVEGKLAVKKEEQKDHKTGFKEDKKPAAAAASASSSSSSSASAAVAPPRTATQKKNEAFLRRFAEKVEGIACSSPSFQTFKCSMLKGLSLSLSFVGCRRCVHCEQRFGNAESVPK